MALLLLRRSLRLGDRDESGVDDLPTTGLETLTMQVGLKQLEELLDHASLPKALSKGGDCGGI